MTVEKSFTKELVEIWKFKWSAMHPDRKFMLKATAIAFAVLLGAMAISGIAMWIGPK